MIEQESPQPTKKLDFGFMQHDDMLEACIDNGFVHISGNCRDFGVSGYDGKNFDLGRFDTIYDALDAANEWARRNGKL